ncbi:MAG: sulfatase-like hydrolase/transferase [Verrucomicrobiota bacterium]
MTPLRFVETMPWHGHLAHVLLDGCAWAGCPCCGCRPPQKTASNGFRAEKPSLLAAIFSILFLAGLPLAAKPPNFVVVLGEGHGWSSTSVQMDDAVPASKSATVSTPNLETLANGGMRFADFYAASPRCTPTRAAIFTGKSPAALHMTFVGEGKADNRGAANGKLLPPDCSIELPPGETTIAEFLKADGYATAHFGKWHVGRVDPSRHGFDESDGSTNNGGPENVPNPHPKQLFGMTERGMDFMARQVRAGKPFYLQMSHYAFRHAEGGRQESKESGKPEDGAPPDPAQAEADLDVAFGMVLKKIAGLGIANNTYVIFTTDHGTPGKNPPLAGGKGTVLEGGLRVPFIIRGPGIQPGTCSHVRAEDEDIFPTIAALAGITKSLPDGIEGGSLAGVVRGAGKGAVQRPREEFVVHFPHYDKDPDGPASAILLGDFKLVRIYETGALSLYNIAQDPGERHDLAAEMPEKTKDLNVRLTGYLDAVRAQLPVPNPNYDPSKPADAPRGGEKRKAQQ